MGEKRILRGLSDKIIEYIHVSPPCVALGYYKANALQRVDLQYNRS
jgi:hypothetical protein